MFIPRWLDKLGKKIRTCFFWWLIPNPIFSQRFETLTSKKNSGPNHQAICKKKYHHWWFRKYLLRLVNSFIPLFTWWKIIYTSQVVIASRISDTSTVQSPVYPKQLGFLFIAQVTSDSDGICFFWGLFRVRPPLPIWERRIENPWTSWTVGIFQKILLKDASGSGAFFPPKHHFLP